MSFMKRTLISAEWKPPADGAVPPRTLLLSCLSSCLSSFLSCLLTPLPGRDQTGAEGLVESLLPSPALLGLARFPADSSCKRERWQQGVSTKGATLLD